MPAADESVAVGKIVTAVLNVGTANAAIIAATDASLRSLVVRVPTSPKGSVVTIAAGSQR